MASVGSLSSSTSSSIFNTNKRITGLASGLDTDALIEDVYKRQMKNCLRNIAEQRTSV